MGNHRETINQLARFLMGKVVSFITDTLMHACNNLTSFFSHRNGLFQLLNLIPLALCPCKCLFLFSKKARIRDLFTRAQSDKLLNANIDTYIRQGISAWQGHIAQITRNGCKPLTSGCARYCADFGHTFKRSMLHNTKTANLAQAKSFVIEPASIGKLWIRDRIIASFALISRKTSFAIFRFHSAEERLEGKVNTHRNLYLKDLSIIEIYTYGHILSTFF